jgi:hypothetical protein
MDIEILSKIKFSIEFTTNISINKGRFKHRNLTPDIYKHCLSENAKSKHIPFDTGMWTVTKNLNNIFNIFTPYYTYSESEYKLFYNAINILLSDEFTYTTNESNDMIITIEYLMNTDISDILEYFHTVFMKFTSPERRIINLRKNLYHQSNGYVEFYIPSTKMSIDYITGWLGLLVRFVGFVGSTKFTKKNTFGTFEELFGYIDNDELGRYFEKLMIEYNDPKYNRLVDISNYLISRNSEDILDEDFIAICRNQIISTKILTKLLLNSRNKRLFTILVDITDGSNPNLLLDFDFIVERISPQLRNTSLNIKFLSSIQTSNSTFKFILCKLTTTVANFEIPIIPFLYSKIAYKLNETEQKWNYNDYILWQNVGCPLNINVTSLSIIDSQSINLPNLPNLPNLTSLVIYNCNLDELPDDICQLTKLSDLRVYKNNLTSIPENIGNLKSLERLYLNDNKITKLPESICELTNLKHLILSMNRISKLPNCIEQLQNLLRIEIRNNLLSSLPIGIVRLQNLKVLELDNNEFEMLPDDIVDLQQLKTLSVSNNHLIMLPLSMGNLRNLEYLNVSNNNLDSIPNSIGMIGTLEYLDVYHNHLLTLPATLASVGNLEIMFEENPEIILPMRLQRVLVNNVVKNHNRGVYGDAQNVHDNTLQQSIKDSIKRLVESDQPMNYEQVMKSIANDPILTETVKATLSTYASDPDIVSVINVNYLEILVAVWNRIVINENSVEIKLRLNQEIMDCKFGDVCFTGKISRLVNCLSGFDDIVDVRISDAEQIGIIISLVKERLTNENMYTVDLHKSIVRDRLHELNYPDDIIDTWISFIVVENNEQDV